MFLYLLSPNNFGTFGPELHWIGQTSSIFFSKVLQSGIIRALINCTRLGAAKFTALACVNTLCELDASVLLLLGLPRHNTTSHLIPCAALALGEPLVRSSGL